LNWQTWKCPISLYYPKGNGICQLPDYVYYTDLCKGIRMNVYVKTFSYSLGPAVLLDPLYREIEYVTQLNRGYYSLQILRGARIKTLVMNVQNGSYEALINGEGTQNIARCPFNAISRGNFIVCVIYSTNLDGRKKRSLESRKIKEERLCRRLHNTLVIQNVIILTCCYI
jgi:hypothetical protein